MMIKRPRAASMPPINAAPYPLCATSIRRAPIRVATLREPSTLPLSATMISPSMLCSCRHCCAFSMQLAKVSTSSKQGMTTDNSGEESRSTDWERETVFIATVLCRVIVLAISHHPSKKLTSLGASDNDQHWGSVEDNRHKCITPAL